LTFEVVFLSVPKGAQLCGFLTTTVPRDWWAESAQYRIHCWQEHKRPSLALHVNKCLDLTEFSDI